MFHTKFDHGGESCVMSLGELALQAFLVGHDEDLGHAAVLLAGRRGARLVNAIREGVDQPGRMTRRVQRLLLELRGILFLDHAPSDDWEAEGRLATIAPDDPIVPEICLLADGLHQALLLAGLTAVADEHTI